jgi:hypothetical protein
VKQKEKEGKIKVTEKEERSLAKGGLNKKRKL